MGTKAHQWREWVVWGAFIVAMYFVFVIYGWPATICSAISGMCCYWYGRHKCQG